MDSSDFNFKILPRSNFEKLVVHNMIDYHSTACICVVSSHEEIENHSLYGTDNTLILRFDDIDGMLNITSVNGEKLEFEFTDMQAEQVVDFLFDHVNFKSWILHCDAGISRSGAIGNIVAKFFEHITNNPEIYNVFLREYAFKIHPNKLVTEKITEKLSIRNVDI